MRRKNVCRRRFNIFLCRVAACIVCAITARAGETPLRPDPEEVRELLNRLVPEKTALSEEEAAGVRRKLRTIADLYPELLEGELVELRRREDLLLDLLDTGGRQETRFSFRGKLQEAHALYREKQYGKAVRICEALIVLGAEPPVKQHILRLMRLAKDRVFTSEVLFVNLKGKKKQYEGSEPLHLELTIENRLDRRVVVRFPYAARLTVTVTTVSSSGRIVVNEVVEELQLPAGPVALAPGRSWSFDASLETMGFRNGSFALEPVRVEGRIVRAHIEAEGERFDRSMRIPRVELLRVAEGYAEVVKNPVYKLQEAIGKKDATQLFIASSLLAWEGEYERVFALVLEALKNSPELEDVGYLVLRLMTGKNFQQSRRRWISYYLGRETLVVNPPLFR